MQEQKGKHESLQHDELGIKIRSNEIPYQSADPQKLEYLQEWAKITVVFPLPSQ